MATAGYLFFWVTALILAVGLGTASHYANAFLSLPEKVVDGFRWREHALNKAMNDEYTWWADYDEGGFWEFYSLKNFLIHVAPPTFLVLVFGLAYFPERAEIVTKVCGTVAQIGLKPLFCM